MDETLYVYAHFRVWSERKTISKNGPDAASLVMGHKWLITSSLAWSKLTLADVAGRTIAVTNAQSCSKAIADFFFSSREPTNSSSPQCPSSSSKTQSMPFTLPPSASSFPSCTQAHPCQRKSKAAIRAIDTWNSLILTYLNWSLCLTWCSRSTSTEEPEASAQKQQATCTLKTFYFRRAKQKLPGSKLDATGL